MARRVQRYKSEANLHEQVADYLRLQYPAVLFHTDFAAGIKMTMGQAVKNKRLQSGRGWPDLFIAHRTKLYSGLGLELKKEGVRIVLQNGNFTADKHVREQLAVIEQLQQQGYAGRIVVGFEQAKACIDAYMAGRMLPTYTQLAAMGKPRHPLHEDDTAF